MPRPPPSVYDTAPTLGAEPFSGASPCGAAASTTWPQRAPAPFGRGARGGIDLYESIRRVLIRTPPSEAPGSPCPVACTPTGSARRAAWATAAITSSVVSAPTTRAGRVVKPVWNPAISSSYPSSPGRKTNRCAVSSTGYLRCAAYAWAAYDCPTTERVPRKADSFRQLFADPARNVRQRPVRGRGSSPAPQRTRPRTRPPGARAAPACARSRRSACRRGRTRSSRW